MRDTDRERLSHIITKTADAISTVDDLRGKTVAVGAKDSPQATLIPLHCLQRHGLKPGRDFQVRRSDVLVGKHGDHVGGELQAFQCLARGEADASAILDPNWKAGPVTAPSTPMHITFSAQLRLLSIAASPFAQTFPTSVSSGSSRCSLPCVMMIRSTAK